MTSPGLPHRKAEPHSMGFTLSAIMLVVLMLGLGAASALSALHNRTKPPAAAESATVSRALVGRQLNIPAAWLRGPANSGAQGFASEVELSIALPLGTDGGLLPVAVTLLPLSQARPSAELLDGVYLHQFMPNELSGPPGLVGKPLYANEGYANETVWYDALSQSPFVAKCMAPVAGASGGNCLRTVALPGGIAAIYRFDASALYGWKNFDRLMDEQLKRIGVLG
ncbi:MAG TPA: hypothetical protein VHB74_14575 [Devosia sp.]|nr:hypothetical protein [Devosia sp.]